MKEPRKIGLALILLGVLVLLGNTTEALPPEAFFAGLFLYPIGGYLFFKGSRQAINRAEVRVAGIKTPKLKNETAERYAEKQRANFEARASVDVQVPALKKSAEASTATNPALDKEELVLCEIAAEQDEEEFKVSTDVSFPIEVQEHDSLADQIMKLQRLREDGIISEEELAIAKAKLLD